MLRRKGTSYFHFSYLFKLLLLFCAYFVSARLGLLLDPVGGFATLVWPPTGIALAALLLFGPRLWPAIALGAFFANFTQGAIWYVAVGIAAGNTLEALFGIYLLKKFANIRKSLDNLRDVLSFLFYASILSTLVSATIGSLSLSLGGVISSTTFLNVWTAWWVGDMLGSAVVTPFILFWAKGHWEKISLPRVIETTVLFSFLIIVSFVIFRGLFGIDVRVTPITYLLYLPLFLISLRLGLREYSSAMILLSAIAIWGTLEGYGIFALGSVAESLFYLQLFALVTVFTFLPLSVLVQEKREFEKRKDEFLAIASHELKTPITTIKAYSDLLKKKFLFNNSSKKYILTIDDQIKRLTKLINDMLDITKITSGKIELGFEEFEIIQFVRKAVRDIEKSTKSKRFVFVGKVKDVVYADRYKVYQVLTNLLINAIKYSDNKVTVRVKSQKNFVTISVKDLGGGIEKQYQKDVFTRFYQGPSKSNERKQGLGLGLYISYQIIRQHKGKMWLKSDIGRGSTFYFTLPKSRKIVKTN